MTSLDGNVRQSRLRDVPRRPGAGTEKVSVTLQLSGQVSKAKEHIDANDNHADSPYDVEARSCFTPWIPCIAIDFVEKVTNTFPPPNNQETKANQE